MAEEVGSTLSYGDMIDYVTEIDRRTDGSPSPKLYVMLANQVLKEVADSSASRILTWSNAAGGAFTIVGRTVVLPVNCVRIQTVYWDNLPLTNTTRASLDARGSWIDGTGDPEQVFQEGRTLSFDNTPTGVVTGKLKAVGIGTVPKFTFGVTPAADANPMLWIPEPFQLIVPFGILAKLPAKNDAQVARKNEYSGYYERDKPLCMEAIQNVLSSDFNGFFGT